MRRAFIKSFSALLIALVLIPVFHAAAADYSDPAVTDLIITPEKPAPSSEVDFFAVIQNHGSLTSQAVSLVVDFDENIFKRIVVGDPQHCSNTGVTVNCTLSPLESGESTSIGFTGFVADNAVLGEVIPTYATVQEVGNAEDRTENNLIQTRVIIGNQVKKITTPPAGLTKNELIETKTPLDSPSDHQDVSLIDVKNDPNWTASDLYTTGLKFIIRGKEALAWTLGINNSSFDQPAIRQNYNKVLTVVNSLFIVGLLIIAGMWVFSLLIPRSMLKRVILIYGIAVVLINFAFPLNQLLIDGSNLLQQTFISGVDINHISKTPEYTDPAAIGYQNISGQIPLSSDQTINLSINDNGGNDQVTDGDVAVGRIGQNLVSLQKPNYIGTIMMPIADQDGKITDIREEAVQLRSTSDQVLTLNAQQDISLVTQQSFDPNREHSLFALLMLVSTGLAYFGMALVFIFRIIILWVLLIVSPVLFFLAIFKATRSYFINWVSVYARWLLIGPLLALGLSVIVSIWETSGLPITSSYLGGTGFGLMTNVGFYLPGSTTINTLSSTSEMMEYFLFLIMLYVPLFFAFMLTRQKVWSSAATVFSEKIGNKLTLPRQSSFNPEINQATGESSASSKPDSLFGGVKNFFQSMNKNGQGLMSLSSEPIQVGKRASSPENPASFLPEHLAVTPMKELLELSSGRSSHSRNAHQKAIESLAHPETIPSQSREHLTRVKQEINKRAEQNDPEAVRVLAEIDAVRSTTSFTSPSTPAVESGISYPAENKPESKQSMPTESKNNSFGLSKEEKEAIETLNEDEDKVEVKDAETKNDAGSKSKRKNEK